MNIPNIPNNCGYHLSPYAKTATGLSYADEVYLSAKTYTPFSTRLGPARTALAPKPVHILPDEIFATSLSHYEQNNFARLLRQHFGLGVANDLLRRFCVGTSNHWQGACVFWYIDEQGRKRGGQIKLFGPDWHTVKFTNSEGEKHSRITWVHKALIRRYVQRKEPVPDWLRRYHEGAERSPCLFGLPQLKEAPATKPVAIVEAPKTAILATPYFPDFIWLAAGAKSYLNAERLKPVRSRRIVLVPDLDAFQNWKNIAASLAAEGYNVEVKDYLQRHSTHVQKQAGYDLADFLIEGWQGYPPSWDA